MLVSRERFQGFKGTMLLQFLINPELKKNVESNVIYVECQLTDDKIIIGNEHCNTTIDREDFERFVYVMNSDHFKKCRDLKHLLQKALIAATEDTPEFLLRARVGFNYTING